MESLANLARIVVKPIDSVAKGIRATFGIGSSSSEGGAGVGAAAAQQSPPTGGGPGSGGNVQINSPTTFILSRYSATLLFLSLLVNRIHVHVPPRRILHQNPTSNAHPSLTRFLLRLPGLIALARAVVVIMLRCGYATWMIRGGQKWEWIMGTGMDEDKLMWTTFLSVALAVLSETFVRCLEDDADRTQGFNLLSFAFLLHIHSPPTSSSSSPPTQHHLHLLFTLLEIFFLHLSFSLPSPLIDRLLHPFSPPRPHPLTSSNSLRLPITAFFSLLSQIYFFTSLFNDFQSLSFGVPTSHGGPTRYLTTLEQPHPDQNAMQRQVVYEYETVGWEGTVWLNRFPEMAMEVLVGLSLGLRFLAALLRREEISQESILGHPSHWPRVDDDYAVAMIRYGTSLLESTRLAGLANEVAPIISGPFNLFSDSLVPGPNALIPSISLSSSLSSYSHRPATSAEVSQHARKRIGMKEEDGLGNEILAIDAVPRGTPKDPMSRQERSEESWKLLKLILRIVNFAVVWVARGPRSAWRWWVGVARRVSGKEELSWNVRAGEEDVDEEDEDWVPGDSEGSSESESESESEVEMELEMEQEEEEEDLPANLYTDLSSPARSFRHSSPLASTSTSLIPRHSPFSDDEAEEEDSTYSPILLAHHLSTPNSAPLTRRRYQSLLSRAGAGAGGVERGYSTAIVERRREAFERLEEKRQEREREDEGGRMRFCVVCTVEERSIIVWPCRCLVLCEECRENLSERTPASQHLCPTCRTPVKGFSRIFVP